LKKNVKSPYLCNRLTDFDEIWHDAYWPPVKISNLKKSKMAEANILKITEIAISPQRFDRSLRNLVQRCKTCLLTAPVVRKFKFQKSNMADGRYIENP